MTQPHQVKGFGMTIEELAMFDAKLTARLDAPLDADHRRVLIALSVQPIDFVHEGKWGDGGQPNQIIKIL
jgi:hypothetical protein